MDVGRETPGDGPPSVTPGARLLLVFLKAPRPGEVKTRLAPLLGSAGAADLFRAMAEAELGGTTPAHASFRRIIGYAPADARAEVAAWLPGEELWPQSNGDLGDRMAAAFDQVFSAGAERVALIGTDVPWLTREDVERALRQLDDADVVLGPSADGGYYLIAQREPHRALFEGIAWSTPHVLAETVLRAERLGLRLSLLEPHRDIDTPEDLLAEWPRLRVLLARQTALLAEVEAAIAAWTRS
jgi:rSAM/selenodomain-associated transferase 1